MKVDVLLGLQWGDEGKGKIVDVMTPNYDVVARFQGGPNAGHTLEFNGKKMVLHTIPSGVFREHNLNLIGNGVVIDPITFKKEIDTIHQFGVRLDKTLFISKKAHLILPSHKMIDAAQEMTKGHLKIGSTLKGIGPTYTDKISRNGIRVGDILEHDFKQKLDHLVSMHKTYLDQMDYDHSDLSQQLNHWYESLEVLKSYTLVDGEYFINELLQKGKKVLAEGAQGTLLDVDFGSYPFVTSSNTICAGACTGLGISPQKIGNVIGVFKAYCTRVGSGPFPTELNDQMGEAIRQKGREFGSTTGRPRRCGWLDIPALNYAIMVNGVNKLIMMKADVLGELDHIQICTQYQVGGKETQELPYRMETEQISPLYQTLQGWKQDISMIKTPQDLPSQVFDYVKFIEKNTQIPVGVISCGPDRDQTFQLN